MPWVLQNAIDFSMFCRMPLMNHGWFMDEDPWFIEFPRFKHDFLCLIYYFQEISRTWVISHERQCTINQNTDIFSKQFKQIIIKTISSLALEIIPFSSKKKYTSFFFATRKLHRLIPWLFLVYIFDWMFSVQLLFSSNNEKLGSIGSTLISTFKKSKHSSNLNLMFSAISQDVIFYLL